MLVWGFFCVEILGRKPLAAGRFAFQLSKQIPDDPFGLKLLGLPEFPKPLPGAFAGVQVFFSLPERDFPEFEEIVSFLDPFGHHFSFAKKFLTLLCQAESHLLDLSPLAQQRILALLIELGNSSPSLFDPLLGTGFTNGLGELSG